MASTSCVHLTEPQPAELLAHEAVGQGAVLAGVADEALAMAPPLDCAPVLTWSPEVATRGQRQGRRQLSPDRRPDVWAPPGLSTVRDFPERRESHADTNFG